MSVADRIAHFWSRVDKSGECWLWTGGCTPKGYGLVSCGRRPDGRQLNDYAHRVAYKLTKGPIPDHLELLHSCDVRRCCRPAHLTPDTHHENLLDASRKGRLGGERPGRWILPPDVRRAVVREGLTGDRGTIARLAREHGLTVQYVAQLIRRARAKSTANHEASLRKVS